MAYPQQFVPPFEGATEETPGTSGLVPQPVAGQQGRFLRGDSTWQDLTGTIAAAQTAAAGSATAAGQSATAAGQSATAAGQSATAAGQSATDAGQSATDAQEAQAAAEAAQDIAIQTAQSMAGAVHLKGVTSTAAAPASPANGDLWLIGVAGTWGSITWAIGDYAVYVSASSAWQRIAMATALAGEQAARRAGDISRVLSRDFYNTPARIPAITPPSAPLSFLFTCDLAAALASTTISFLSTRIAAGAGLIFFCTTPSVYLEARDVTGGLGQIVWPSSVIPTGPHTFELRILGTWSGGVTGRIQAELRCDGVLLTSTGRFASALTTFDFSGGVATHPVTICGGNVYTDNATGAPVHFKMGRAMLYYGTLPLTRAEGVTAGVYYSLEQYDALEDPPSTLPVFYLKDIAGGQWRDSSNNRTHAYIEATASLPNVPVVNTATLTWTADGTPKAFLSGTNNVIPAGSKITVAAKSTANVDVVITDGAASPSTLITLKSLVANVWQELGTAFVATACKLAVDPTVFTGSISLQVKIEPLN